MNIKKLVILASFFVSAIAYAGVPSDTVIDNSKPSPELYELSSAESATQSGDSAPSLKTYIVKFRKGTSVQKKLQLHQEVGVVDTFSLIQQNSMDIIQTDKNPSEVIKLYEQNVDVLYIEPDMQVQMLVTTPNDTDYSKLWGLHNTGQTSGLVDSDINAPQAWDVTTGTTSAVIAVIDTGVDYTHPDLVDNMWKNPREIAGNGIDDDGNGYIDDIYGIDTLNDDTDPMDDNNHGTHVAGTIGAKGNNGRGVVGVNWQTKILACKFLGARGGSTSGAIKCLDYLATLKRAGVNIIASNNSWGGGGYSRALYDAIKVNQDLGILFIAAAGNSRNNNDAVPSYPATYDLPGIISVAATDHRDQLAYFSSYGKTTVDVAAPGMNIYSTIVGNQYKSYNGTSMATPHVAGLVGLIYAYSPTLTSSQIKSLVLSSGTPVEALSGVIFSGRRIRAWDSNNQGALSCVNQRLATRLAPLGDAVSVRVGDSIHISYAELNCANHLNTATLSVSDGSTVLLTDTGASGDTVANDGILGGRFTLASTHSRTLTFPDGSRLVVNPLRPYNNPISAPFAYETITGSRLSIGDDTTAEITSPFPISFASENVGNKVYISANGVIFFGATHAVDYRNKSIPSSSLPGTGVLVPYWDDLNPSRSSSGGIFWQVLGSSPNRKLVIEWRNVAHYLIPNGVTFQVVLSEGSSDIRYNYKEMSFGNSNYDNGKSATIGLQQSHQFAKQYCFNTTNCIADRTSLLYTVNDVSATTPIIHNVGITNASGVTNTTAVAIGFAVSATATSGRTITRYQIDFNGDNTYDYSGTNSVATYTYNTVGDYIYKVRVTDSANETTQYYGLIKISVSGTTPIIHNVGITSTSGVTSTTAVDISFAVSATATSGRTITRYQIDFNGDNTYDYSGTNSVATYTYNTVGDYIYKVRVTDSANETTQYYGSIKISLDATNFIRAIRSQRDAEILADPSILGLVRESHITHSTVSSLSTNAWHLLANPLDISSSMIGSVFASAHLVLYYQDGHYYGYSPVSSVQQQIDYSDDVIGVDSIPAGLGVWIFKR